MVTLICYWTLSLTESLSKTEISRIADALIEKTFRDGEYAVRQGDNGDEFFIIAEGNARVFKSYGDDDHVDLAKLGPGDFFGELALITDNPRAANVTSVGKMVAVTLDRGAFTRLLGPITDILKRNQQTYEEVERKLYQEKLEVFFIFSFADTTAHQRSSSSQSFLSRSCY